MEKVYKIAHNISKCLGLYETESNRYFADLRYANGIFEQLASNIDYSKDEWISLDEVEIDCKFGEYQSKKETILRYFSDDTKIGVEFDITEH